MRSVSGSSRLIFIALNSPGRVRSSLGYLGPWTLHSHGACCQLPAGSCSLAFSLARLVSYWSDFHSSADTSGNIRSCFCISLVNVLSSLFLGDSRPWDSACSFSARLVMIVRSLHCQIPLSIVAVATLSILITCDKPNST